MQHAAHRLIGRMIAPGDLAQGLPLGDPLQDYRPLCRRNFEERNQWIAMLLLGWGRRYATDAQLLTKQPKSWR
jgi:hypothetical protein